MSFDPAGLARALADHGNVVRVVVAEVQGSAPREAGASMLVWDSGQSGTIGGGALEFRASDTAREMLDTGERRRLTRAILGPDIGQCCGGAVALLYERFDSLPETGPTYARPVEEGAARTPDETTRTGLAQGWFTEPVATPPRPVWIWGAGHVGRAIATTLAPLPGLAVTLIDTSPDRLPTALPATITLRIAPDLPGLVPEAPPDTHHYILTYSHDLDFALCDALLTRGFAAAGLIGSATKWARFRSRLVQSGHDPAAIERIRCPIGTPALGKDPAAIAVGVAHALLMVLAKKEAVSPVAERGTE